MFGGGYGVKPIGGPWPPGPYGSYGPESYLRNKTFLI